MSHQSVIISTVLFMLVFRTIWAFWYLLKVDLLGGLISHLSLHVDCHNSICFASHMLLFPLFWNRVSHYFPFIDWFKQLLVVWYSFIFWLICCRRLILVLLCWILQYSWLLNKLIWRHIDSLWTDITRLVKWHNFSPVRDLLICRLKALPYILRLPF